ncbi:MAG: hypothetical protein WBM14_08135 [Terracidiphilus sp.]
MNRLETPVTLMVFNRPETTRRVFAAVAAARPARLLLIADGSRADRCGEAERCEEVRKIVTAVDWPCQVETNFAGENMGCRQRVISGLNWVFSRVEEAIILEDDCLPDPSFFPYCSQLLDRYRDRPQIAFISGFNPLEKSFPLSFSYSYSLPMSFSIWGWATWRRAWQEYDEHMRGWPEVRQAGLLRHLFPDEKVVAYWTRIFDSMHQGTGANTWDYQWIYTCWTRNWLNILPARNLVQNLGFGPGATHTTVTYPDYDIPAGSVSFPLAVPPAITAWPAYAMQAQKRLYAPGILRRIRRKLFRLRSASR